MTDLRLVIFDVDGTLVDSQADILSAMGAAFAVADLPAPSRPEILGIVGLSLPQAIAHLAPEADAAQLDAMVVGYKAAYTELRAEGGVELSSPLYPGIREVLETLNARPETLLGVATGKSRRGLDKLLDGHGLRELFVTQQCADDHPSKPHPAMLHEAVAVTGVDAARAVMIGDTEFDMEMARAAGLPGIGVSWGYHPVSRLGAAHTVIDKAAELPALLDTLWEAA
ncbi:HAD family hydrolase [Roseivivax halodurans JCM 10272]|uniref:HAD family hydrolase n=1 Tax=Roseivivax halodurans JCM 10272 TaxID=1449350 RepID=X7EIG8_9RHOB|nr:HAD-IA family hydrolase [Roseivivax halodurans]ETX14956.1 HAD family hydrolase [Roseivivax halodurans JCM 10272]